MGSNFYSRALRGCPPSRSQPETPMPPDRMTGFNPWPWDPHHGLSVRCVLWKGVDNLLNHTLSPAGTSGGTNKEGSYWSRLGLQPTQVVQESSNNITISGINHHPSSLTMPYRTYSYRRGTRDKLVSTQDHDFPGFLPVCMESSRGWLLSPAYPFLTVKHLQYALMRVTVSLHRNNACSKSRWCCNCIKTPHENIMPEFRMLAFKSMQGGALFESFLLSPFPIFLKKFK